MGGRSRHADWRRRGRRRRYSDRSAGVRVALDGRPDSGNDADGPAGARDTLSTDLEVLFGGAGDDALDGNASENYLDAGAGNDVINSRDASGDADYCGDGNDTAFVDADDLSHATCETVYLPGQEPRPPAPVPPVARDTTRPTVAVRLAARQRLRSSLRKGLVLRTTCSERCQLTLPAAGAAVGGRASRTEARSDQRPASVSWSRVAVRPRMAGWCSDSPRKHVSSCGRSSRSGCRS